MHLLEPTGNLTAAPAPANVSLAGDTPPDTLTAADVNTDAIIIEFATTADGRGFSLARHLRGRFGFGGTLLAGGKLIPDQVQLAFQCGFDGVLLTDGQLDQYATDFVDAVKNPPVTLNYRQTWADSTG